MCMRILKICGKNSSTIKLSLCAPWRLMGFGGIVVVVVIIVISSSSSSSSSRLRLKCDGTRAETRFRLSAKRTIPFKSAGASVQSTTGSRGVRISGSNAGYTNFRGSVKGDRLCGLVVRVSGYRYRGLGFDSRRYQIF